jgi:ABC-2 type transport system permease protein
MSTAAAPHPAPAAHLPVHAAGTRAAHPASTRRLLRAVVRRGLRDEARATLAWGAGFGVFGAFIVAIYPSVQDTLTSLTDSYPDGLKEAFGVSDMGTAGAYLHAELYSMIVPIAVAIFAVRTVARRLTGAEERGELDTVLALPLPRRVLAAGALAVAALTTAAVLAIMTAMTVAAAWVAGADLAAGRTLVAGLAVWAPACFFAAVAVLAAGWQRRSAIVTGAAAGTVVAMYALDLAGRLAPAVEPMRWASVDRYTGAPLLGDVRLVSLAGILLAAAVPAVAGIRRYERRDIGR